MSGDLSHDERRRLTLCRGIALLAPIIAASASFAVLRTAWLIGGPRMMMTPAGRSFWSVYEHGVMPGNALLGSVAAAVAVLFLHPVAGRRWRIALGWLVAAPAIYLITYVAWERLWWAAR